MSEVKTRVVWLQDGFGGGGHAEVCLASDYAALEAECERLTDELAAEIQKRWDGNEQSSREHREEIDQLRAELAALKAQQVGQESEPAPKQHPDDAAVDRFAAAMKAKLARSREKGRHGWQNCTAPHLSAMLYDHLYKADPLDVGNFAMMLHQNGQAIELPFEARGRHTAPQPAPAQDMAGWIPVAERLPSSRQPVLACYTNAYGHGRTIRAQWLAKFQEESDDIDNFDAEYDEETDTYYAPEGWYELIDNWGEYSSVGVTEGIITHWMPLPAAPADQRR